MSTEIRTLLENLVEDQPATAIDLDRQIAIGRRRTHYRNVGTGVLSVAAAAALIGGVLAVQPGAQSMQPAQSSTSTASTPLAKPSGVGSVPDTVALGSGPKSRQLLDEVTALAQAEIAQQNARPTTYDTQGGPTYSLGHELHTVLGWKYPYRAGKARGAESNELVTDAGTGSGDQRICAGMNPQKPKGWGEAKWRLARAGLRCTAVKRLPDGSLAYIRAVESGRLGNFEFPSNAVRVVRPDGTHVVVTSTVQRRVGSSREPLFTTDRLLEIAQKITVRP